MATIIIDFENVNFSQKLIYIYIYIFFFFSLSTNAHWSYVCDPLITLKYNSCIIYHV